MKTYLEPTDIELMEQVATSERDRLLVRFLFRLGRPPIDGHTLAMLVDYITHNQLASSGSSLIFGINRHRAWQIVRDCARRAGLPDLVNPETGRVRGVSPHRLRDAFSVHAIKLDDSGDALRLFQEHLGHASFNTTAKYRKIAGEEHREWYDRLWQGTGARG